MSRYPLIEALRLHSVFPRQEDRRSGAIRFGNDRYIAIFYAAGHEDWRALFGVSFIVLCVFRTQIAPIVYVMRDFAISVDLLGKRVTVPSSSVRYGGGVVRSLSTGKFDASLLQWLWRSGRFPHRPGSLPSPTANQSMGSLPRRTAPDCSMR